MNTTELLKALADYPKEKAAEYIICGKVPGDGFAYSDHLFLEQEGDQWVIGYFERGKVGSKKYYSSEDEACQAFYKRAEKYRNHPNYFNREIDLAEEEAGRRIGRRMIAEAERDLAEDKRDQAARDLAEAHTQSEREEAERKLAEAEREFAMAEREFAEAVEAEAQPLPVFSEEENQLARQQLKEQERRIGKSLNKLEEIMRKDREECRKSQGEEAGD